MGNIYIGFVACCVLIAKWEFADALEPLDPVRVASSQNNVIGVTSLSLRSADIESDDEMLDRVFRNWIIFLTEITRTYRINFEVNQTRTILSDSVRPMLRFSAGFLFVVVDRVISVV